MPNIIIFSRLFVQSKKVTFYNLSSQRRYTYKISNFVRLRIGGQGILRIGQIVVYIFEGRQRLFVLGTLLPLIAGIEDPILGRGYRCIYLTVVLQPTLFRLPSISAEYLYIVPVYVQQGNEASISLAIGKDTITTTNFIQSQYILQQL